MYLNFPFICRFAQVRNAGIESVQRSVKEGIGLEVKKSNVLTREESY
jgi:hypothetical protein